MSVVVCLTLEASHDQGNSVCAIQVTRGGRIDIQKAC